MSNEKESSLPEVTKAQWEMMYYAQCRLSDELAAKLEAGSDKTLLARIAELESALATMNRKYVEAQRSPAKSLLRPVGERPSVCYCPPDKCMAPDIHGQKVACVRLSARITNKTDDA